MTEEILHIKITEHWEPDVIMPDGSIQCGMCGYIKEDWSEVIAYKKRLKEERKQHDRTV